MVWSLDSGKGGRVSIFNTIMSTVALFFSLLEKPWTVAIVHKVFFFFFLETDSSES